MNNIEILEELEKYISFANKQCNFSNDADYKWHKELAGMIENLIKENKELQEYANWHIEHLTEDIEDYIDDDRKGNASIIGEFKEEREHWKDIIRIINNEKTYIDYKNY